MKNLFLSDGPPELNFVATCVDNAGRVRWRLPLGGVAPVTDPLWVYNAEPGAGTTTTLAPNPVSVPAGTTNFAAPLPTQSYQQTAGMVAYDYNLHVFRAGQFTSGFVYGAGAVELGTQNQANGANAVTVGGNGNTIDTADQSFIGSGIGNTVANSVRSHILEGSSNNITAGCTNVMIYTSASCAVSNSVYGFIVNSATSTITDCFKDGHNLITSSTDASISALNGQTNSYNTILGGSDGSITCTNGNVSFNTIVNGSTCSVNESFNCTILNGVSPSVSLSSNCVVSGNNSRADEVAYSTAVGNATKVFDNANFSFVCGQNASASVREHMFVFGDNFAAYDISDASNSFNARATTGVLMQTNGLVVTDTISAANMSTIAPGPSVLVQFISATRGVLMPYPPNTAVITVPLKGMIIFNTGTGKLQGYDGTNWFDLF